MFHVFREFQDRCCQRLRGPGWDQQAPTGLGHQFGERGQIAGDHGDTHRHSLERLQRRDRATDLEIPTGQSEGVQQRVVPWHLFLRDASREHDGVLESELSCLLLEEARADPSPTINALMS